MTTEPTPIALPRYSECFVCGNRNPIGLDLTFQFVPDRIEARFTPQARHAGYRDLVHGGILATMLDECMGWSSIISRKVMCLAAEMSVRYKHSARVGEPLRVYAELVADRRRLFEARGVVEREQDGLTLCTASGKFAPLPPPAQDELVAYAGWEETLERVFRQSERTRRWGAAPAGD